MEEKTKRRTELDRQIAARKEDIMDAAILEFIENGIDNSKISDIAKRAEVGTVTVYRYFENKHRLLIYIAAWYWNWVEYRINFQTNNIKDPFKRLQKVIKLLATTVVDDKKTFHVDENLLHQIIIAEGSKAYLTKQVGEDNKHHFFKPYKDLCATIGDIILECNPKYKYPISLSTTIIEMAHLQNFFMNNLPSLTDFGNSKDEKKIVVFLENLVFSSLK